MAHKSVILPEVCSADVELWLVVAPVVPVSLEFINTSPLPAAVIVVVLVSVAPSVDAPSVDVAVELATGRLLKVDE